MKQVNIHRDYFAGISQFVNRKEYNSSLARTILTPKKIDFNGDLEQKKHEIIRSLEKQSVAILSTQITSKVEDDLVLINNYLSSFLGTVQVDKNPGKLFYAKIESIKNPKYYINSSVTQPMHTDEGYTVHYPDIVALYCRQQAKRGGDSVLALFEPLYERLQDKFGEAVKLLFSKDAVTVDNARGTESKPILIHLNKGYASVGISYSPILKNMSCQQIVSEMYKFITEYVHTPENQLQFRLEEGDVLILDNTRVLHARIGFSENETRLLYRLWYNRD